MHGETIKVTADMFGEAPVSNLDKDTFYFD